MSNKKFAHDTSWVKADLFTVIITLLYMYLSNNANFALMNGLRSRILLSVSHRSRFSSCDSEMKKFNHLFTNQGVKESNFYTSQSCAYALSQQTR